jgi:hypothetical protein
VIAIAGLGYSWNATGNLETYYAAAVRRPPIAALLGTGASLAWDRREDSRVRLAVLAAVPASAAYAVWLLPGRGVGTVSGKR